MFINCIYIIFAKNLKHHLSFADAIRSHRGFPRHHWRQEPCRSWTDAAKSCAEEKLEMATPYTKEDMKAQMSEEYPGVV